MASQCRRSRKSPVRRSRRALDYSLAMLRAPTRCPLNSRKTERSEPCGTQNHTSCLAALRAPFALFAVLAAALSLFGGESGSHAEYIGGTESQVQTNCSGVLNAVDEVFFTFSAKQVQMRIPYERINLLEYGQKVNGRYVEAILISPLFLMSKKREHYLTVGFEDNEGKQQALIFKVSKNDIRTILVSLEAKTGQLVRYQDEEARKGGKD